MLNPHHVRFREDEPQLCLLGCSCGQLEQKYSINDFIVKGDVFTFLENFCIQKPLRQCHLDGKKYG